MSAGSTPPTTSAASEPSAAACRIASMSRPGGRGQRRAPDAARPRRARRRRRPAGRRAAGRQRAGVDRAALAGPPRHPGQPGAGARGQRGGRAQRAGRGRQPLTDEDHRAGNSASTTSPSRPRTAPWPQPPAGPVSACRRADAASVHPRFGPDFGRVKPYQCGRGRSEPYQVRAWSTGPIGEALRSSCCGAALTVDMLKSGTRSAGIAVRRK